VYSEVSQATELQRATFTDQLQFVMIAVVTCNYRLQSFVFIIHFHTNESLFLQTSISSYKQLMLGRRQLGGALLQWIVCADRYYWIINSILHPSKYTILHIAYIDPLI